MDDWKKDSFLGNFNSLVPHVNVSYQTDFTEQEESLDGLGDLGNLPGFSAADDETLVNYLKNGEMFFNTSSESSKSTWRDDHEHLDSETQIQVEIPLESVPYMEQLQVEDEDNNTDICHLSSAAADGLVGQKGDKCEKKNKAVKKPTKRSSSHKNKAVEKSAKRSSSHLRPQRQFFISPLIEHSLRTDDTDNPSTSAEHAVSVTSVSRNAQPQSQPTAVTKPPVNSSKHSKGNSHSKGAIASRQRRLKNKQYISDLEASVEGLTEENEQLKKQNSEKTQRIEQLQKQIECLKNMVPDKPTLSSLLSNMLVGNSMKLASSGTLVAAEADKNYQHGIAVAGYGRKRKHSDQVLQTAKDNSVVTSSPKQSCLAVPKAVPGTALSERQQLQDLLCQISGGVGLSLVSVPASSDSDKQSAVSGVKKPKGAPTKKTVGAVQEGSAELEILNADDEHGRRAEGVGGVCLHVLGDSVSMEFCATCNHNALKSRVINHTDQ